MLRSLKVNIYSRSKRHSAAQGAAYRCGIDLICSQTGQRHRYRSRASEVIQSEIVGGRFNSVEQWTNAIEAAEHRSDSQLYRDLVVGLPAELSLAAQLLLAGAWVDCLAEHFRTSILYSVHSPSPDGDNRNFHLHAMVPTRRLAACGTEFQVPGKIKIYHPELRWLVAEWAAFQEACIKSHGVTPRLQPPGPRLHLGKNATALERSRAEQLDRLTAWTENRSYERIRRAVPALLAFTGGVTKAGKEWLREAAHMAAGTTECAQRPVATEEPKSETVDAPESSHDSEPEEVDDHEQDLDDDHEQDLDDDHEQDLDDDHEQDLDDDHEQDLDDDHEQDLDDEPDLEDEPRPELGREQD